MSPKAYTYEELLKMGAQPETNTTRSYTYEELAKMGATPVDTQSKQSTTTGKPEPAIGTFNFRNMPQDERGWYDRTFGVQKTAPEFAPKDMPKPGTLTIGAPQGLLDRLRSFISSKSTDQQMNALNRTVDTGNLLGLNDPMAVFGPGKEAGGRIASNIRDFVTPSLESPNQGPTRSLLNRIRQYRANVKDANVAVIKAKEVIESAPEKRLLINAEDSSKRGAAKDVLRNEKVSAQKGFNQKAKTEISPLIEERRRVANARTNTSADLAQRKTNILDTRTQQLSDLRKETSVARKEAEQEISKRVDGIVKAIGVETDATSIARGSQFARAQSYNRFQEGINSAYARVRSAFSSNPNGGEIDLTGVKKELSPFYERLKADLAIARQNQSPGASAVMQIMEGPDIVSGDIAIDNLAALNSLGYGKADRIFRTSGEAIARTTAAKYRQAMKESIGNMEGGQQILNDLDEAKLLLQKRDALHRTGDTGINKSIARSSVDNIAQGGELESLAKRPVKFKTYWDQIKGTPVEQEVRRYLAEKVVGSGSKDLIKNWSSMAPEVKQMTFTPEEIAQFDSVVKDGPAAIARIAEETIAKRTVLMQEATIRLKDLARQKQELSGLTRNTRELNKLISQEKQAIVEAKESKTAYLQKKAAENKAVFDKEKLAKNTELVREIKAARYEINRHNEAVARYRKLRKQVLWVGGTATLLGIGGASRGKQVAALVLDQ